MIGVEGMKRERMSRTRTFPIVWRLRPGCSWKEVSESFLRIQDSLATPLDSLLLVLSLYLIRRCHLPRYVDKNDLLPIRRFGLCCAVGAEST
jgi:hypothetical protein